MSGRSGAGQIRGATLGPQPLKATVPYQLAIKPRSSRRDGKSAGKGRLHQLSSGMRRTVSLEAIIGPYLQGQWPKEHESQSNPSHQDKSTQTPDFWSGDSHSRKGSSSHKRSASWGSAEHLREISKLKQQLQLQRSKPAVSGGPDGGRQRDHSQGSCSLGATQTQPIPIALAPLSTLVPRLRCSVEGLNQELEAMLICQPPHTQHRLHDVPDGHRAPVPLQTSSTSSSSGGSQSDAATTPLSSSSFSPSPPPSDLSVIPHTSEDAPLDMHQGSIGSVETCLQSPFSSQSDGDTSVLMSSSPGPNKSCCFQREPPEGCEKVRVWEETSTPLKLKPALISSCPDPNKVNFTPHGGSAFCPVSLLKPLLPSMDMLFRSLSVSPTGGRSSPGSGSCQGSSAAGRPSPPDAASTPPVAENSSEGLAFS